MAQKTEKEETEFKVPETLTLCVNNCGVTGNPATNNMCQNCFNATTTTSSSSSPAVASKKTPRSAPIRSSPERSDRKPELKRDSSTQDLPEPTAKKVVNRCFGCRRKVGLTGFRCRCGELFCAEHRYSDRHSCTFDYKAAGREAIARENPVVKAAKIVRV